MSANPKAPRIGRRVTVLDLERLEASQSSHVLYCRRCHGEYSADPADYFWAKASYTFKCCGVNNYLLRKRG